MLPWKKWFESKSIWLGILTVALSLATFLTNEEWVKEYPQLVAILGSAVGILTIILRYFTEKPLYLNKKVKDWRNGKK